MKKKGYYEYDPVIYPRMLCVAIGMNQEDANKCFEGRKGEVLKVDFSNSDAITYDEVREKSNKKLCSFINFASKDSMRMGICCHEASHACDAIEDAIGMEARRRAFCLSDRMGCILHQQGSSGYW